MKKYNLILCLAAVTAVLTSCGGTSTNSDTSGSQSDSQTISFFGWGSAEEQENFQILVNSFMKENPDIKVVYQATSSDTYIKTLNNKGNSLPDVFYMPDYSFMQWADSGKLLPLDDYLTEDELNSMWSLSTSMYRYDRDNFKLGTGSLYCLPKDLGPYAIVYNKDLLKQIINDNSLDISLPDPNVPMNWNDFISYLQKIKTKKNGNTVYPIGYYELMAAVYSNNANFFDSTIKTQTITDKNFIDAVQFVADLSTKYQVAPTADEQSSQNSFQRFLNQGCVFTFMGPWDCKQFWNDLTFEFDIMPTPVGMAKDAKSTSWVGSVGYGVSAKSTKKDAAVKLAKYLAVSNESNVMNYKLGQAIPNVKSIAEGDYVNGVGLTGRQLMPANRKLFVDIVKGNEYVQGKNRCRYYVYDSTFLDDLDDNLSSVYQGNKTASEFLNGYAAKYQEGLDDSNAYLN